MQLSQYVTATQALLNDPLGLLTSVSQVTNWVNEGRRQVAYLTGCLEFLATGMAPYGNSALPGTMVPGGATPGSPLTSSFNTIVGQEKYPYSMALAQIKATNSGIEYVQDVTSIAVSWGSMRPALAFIPWEDFQAYMRSYQYLVTSYPQYWSNDGDGANANVWMFPVPSQNLEMEWQCTCSPLSLNTDSDYDAIPSPFQSSVKYYAAYLSYLGRQNLGMAEQYLELFNRNLQIGRGATERGRVTNWYN